MVYNHEVLFIHLGKTGGLSIGDFMIDSLKPPVVMAINESGYPKSKIGKKRILIPGKRHENLIQATDILAHYRIKLSDFKLIFAVIRDPVDMELSHYKHLRKERVILKLNEKPELDRGRLAMARRDFDTFARSDVTHFTEPLDSYFTINGKVPGNMSIVRFESLDDEVPKLLKPFQRQSIPFPHRNKSEEVVDITSLSMEAILNIREKYSWFYEMGFYKFPPLLENYS